MDKNPGENNILLLNKLISRFIWDNNNQIMCLE